MTKHPYDTYDGPHITTLEDVVTVLDSIDSSINKMNKNDSFSVNKIEDLLEQLIKSIEYTNNKLTKIENLLDKIDDNTSS